MLKVMKKLITMSVALVLATLFTGTIWAQSPQKMSYQAVIRSANNYLVENTVVGMKISILQGTANGTAVYSETHIPTTNSNGLVSIEIGGGTVVSGNYSNINWANGPYFIKTETDPAGGTNYTITGTSQFLSVPYSLHAKTADAIIGGITETDPVFTAWDKDYADLTNKPTLFSGSYADLTNKPTLFSGSYADLTNKPTIPEAANGSETKITAGTNVTITGSGTTASPYIVNATSSSSATTHYIGELYGGGVVFWVDQTGQHGLIVSMVDISTSAGWGSYSNYSYAAKSDWDGNSNTTEIISTFPYTNSAAKMCGDYTNDDYGTGTFSDWYLPSRGEIIDLWNSFRLVQKAIESDTNATTTIIKREAYWTSTSDGYSDAYFFNFKKGLLDTYSIDYYSEMLNVRAVRAF